SREAIRFTSSSATFPIMRGIATSPKLRVVIFVSGLGVDSASRGTQDAQCGRGHGYVLLSGIRASQIVLGPNTPCRCFYDLGTGVTLSRKLESRSNISAPRGSEPVRYHVR